MKHHIKNSILICSIIFVLFGFGDARGESMISKETGVGTEGLVAYWPLDSDWRDIFGGHDLQPLRDGGFIETTYVWNSDNFSYGPTGETENNGAIGDSLTVIEGNQGITLEGWVLIAGNNSKGVLFGFGENKWSKAKLNLSVQWGYIHVTMGKKGDGVDISYPRDYADGNWHHLALVLPPNFQEGSPFSLYMDGKKLNPRDSSAVESVQNTTVFGSGFRIGALELSDAAASRLDEVRLWSRALSQEEISIQATAGKEVETPPPETSINTPIGTDSLVAYWPLDLNWNDPWGDYGLTPLGTGDFFESPFIRGADNYSYGATGDAPNSGAVSETLTDIETEKGLTIEGWAQIPQNNSKGVLFGFGGYGWADAKLNISAQWGYIHVTMGQKGDGVDIRYPRDYADKCWHHLALTIPPNFQEGSPFSLYIDGNKVNPIDSSAMEIAQNATVFGSGFRIGALDLSDTQNSKVDEVRLWSRQLSVEEVSKLATPSGEGEACQGESPPPLNSPQRFIPPENPPDPEMILGIRVISDNTIVMVNDPNPWLKKRIESDSGIFLADLEKNRQNVPDYQYRYHYNFAVKEALLFYRPGMLDALDKNDHFKINQQDQTPQAFLTSNLWPQSTQEFKMPRLGDATGEAHTHSSEVVYFSYLTLPFSMEKGKTYAITDRWGNSTDITYDEDVSVSWALKVNQLGYLPDAGKKYAYLGAWLGPVAGAMNLSRFQGQSFQIRKESDQSVVYEGEIVFRNDDSLNEVKLTGETVYELNFSDFQTPGEYYIYVAGLGRSWTFEISQNAMGEAFYTHARGLFHQRCGIDLSPENTPWSRSGGHATTWKGGFPPDSKTDYADHTADGWGFRDENGAFPDYANSFEVVAYTATEEVVEGLKGGWHDAADFDRRPYHFDAVNDLAHTYLMFPENFSDGQLNLPESHNSIPDILDEAIWGVEVWRLAQEEDGRVATWIEATSHPQIESHNPETDSQRYYLSLATRNSSLHYAAHAALVGRALKRAGFPEEAQKYISSARKAYQFGSDPDVRVSTAFKVGEATHTWTEPPEPDSRRRFLALVQLWLATDDQVFFNELENPAMAEAFTEEVNALYWRTHPYDIIGVALAPAPDKFPTGWSQTAKNKMVQIAEDWLERQSKNSYRKLWYGTDHGYFKLMAWGINGFHHIRSLVTAWRVTGDSRFRDGALLAVDWLHGANPQGRSQTTGLGDHHVVRPLHLPSDSDGISEPVPGITIYGYTGGIPQAARTQVYGLFDDPFEYLQFQGSATAQLPSPWNDPNLQPDEIKVILYDNLPVWRALISLEETNVASSEFTVWETISQAAAVTGALMGAGWSPGNELKNRQPKTEQQLRDHLWYQP